MTLKNSQEPLRRDKLGGCGLGEGDTFPVNIPDGDGAFVMATRLELEPGASVGYHIHEDTEEVYFIMSGMGLYNEEGKEHPASPGDIFLCRLGRSHSIVNTGEGKLILGAAIAKRCK
jgi:mannose-6-phosphate isomerase-like protein (cupin superfamily)